MPNFLMLMHGDATAAESYADWEAYISALRQSGKFAGGSVIGGGQTFRKNCVAAPVTEAINGYILFTADGMTAAQALLAENPTFKAGGTVEIRELPEG